MIRHACFLAVLAAVALPAAATASSTQESTFSDDALLVNGTPAVQRSTLDTMKALGADRVRVSLVWRLVAPAPGDVQKPAGFDAANPAAYPAGAWDRYDRLVRLAAQRGLDVAFDITSPAPNWATGSLPSHPELDPTFDPLAVEYDAFVYRHQLPGGMTGTLINQLNEYGMPEKFPQVIDEIVRVREDLGQPVMATPFSQFVGIQAVLNVVLPERYEIVPDEVLHYALGHYGPLMRPVEPHVADRIFSQPRVKALEAWERDQTTVAEFREKLGKDLSDEELLLRYFCPEDQVDEMLAGPPLRTEPPAASPDLGDQLMQLITEAQARPVSHLSLSQPGIRIDLRR